MSKPTRDAVRQALARGYASPKNSAKVLDPDLIEAMADEVLKLFDGPVPDDRLTAAAKRGFDESSGRPG